jgi:hypothetical protein
VLAPVTKGEVLVPLPCRPHELSPPTHLRGTVLASSFQLVREHGLEAAYFAELPAALHEAIRFVVATSWVELDVARAHFRVMDHIFPETLQQIANGRASSERTQKAYIVTMVRALHASGQISALAFIKRIPSVVERLLRGGGAVTVLGKGLKDARIEMHAHPLVETAYIRNSWQGMFESGIGLTTRRCFVRQDVGFARVDRVAFDISWV